MGLPISDFDAENVSIPDLDKPPAIQPVEIRSVDQIRDRCQPRQEFVWCHKFSPENTLAVVLTIG